jgi:glucose-1-phosphate adenylyltransferase
MVCAGVVISGGTVRRSILSPRVNVHTRALVEDAVLLHGVDIGRDAVVRRAIIDKNVQVPPGAGSGSTKQPTGPGSTSPTTGSSRSARVT